jgi:hypothetical protein
VSKAVAVQSVSGGWPLVNPGVNTVSFVAMLPSISGAKNGVPTIRGSLLYSKSSNSSR